MGHICGGDGGGGEGDCLDSKAAASSGVEHIRTLLVIEAVVMSNRVQSAGGTRMVHPSGFSAPSLFPCKFSPELIKHIKVQCTVLIPTYYNRQFDNRWYVSAVKKP